MTTTTDTTADMTAANEYGFRFVEWVIRKARAEGAAANPAAAAYVWQLIAKMCDPDERAAAMMRGSRYAGGPP